MYYVHELHKTYGPFVRLAPDKLAVADPSSFVAIHRIGSGFLKTSWYEDFAAGVDNSGIGVGLFAMRDPKEHAARRKLFSRALSLNSLRQNCETVIREKAEMATSRILEEVSSPEGRSDILKWWMLMASDVIGELSFGESFGLLKLGKVLLPLPQILTSS